jgi:hypothetical protein
MSQNKKNILCIVGSLNQTSQLHQIASFLDREYNMFYTQLYGDGFAYKFVAESGFFDNTVLGKNSSFTQRSKKYIKENNLVYDYRGESKDIEYDLAIMSTDMVVPSSFLSKKMVWVQEGMIDPLTPIAKLVKKFNLPTFLPGNTSLNGTTNIADIYFAASKGYKKYFNALGTQSEKILTTGVPNFDNIIEMQNLQFEYKDYVLVATSDIRELGGNEDRVDFIKECVKIADGRQLIFKLHPNENYEKAIREIKNNSPEKTLIYNSGSIDPMIAHCHTLITQYSSTVYLGMILGKKIYSYFPIEELEANVPIQNGGNSAEIISEIIRDFMEYEGNKNEFLAQYQPAKQYL